jgi:hypothetical protein
VIRRIVVQGQPGQKVHETQSQPMAAYSGVLIIPAIAGSPKWEDHISGSPEIKVRSYLKINQREKRTGGIAHTVECLPSKLEALSANPSMQPSK